MFWCELPKGKDNKLCRRSAEEEEGERGNGVKGTGMFESQCASDGRDTELFKVRYTNKWEDIVI